MGAYEGAEIENFLQYVLIHSETQLALFSNSDCTKLLELAGKEVPQWVRLKGFTPIYQEEAEILVREARSRLIAQTQSTPNNQADE